MWHRKRIHLFLSILILLIFKSSVFCQSTQLTPIKGFLSADSASVKAGQVSRIGQPVGIGLSRDNSRRIMPSREPLQTGHPLDISPPDCQWVRFHFSGTCWNWFIRKPGTYGGQVLTSSIQSNGKVLMEFKRFNKLLCTDGSGEQMETFYAVSPLSSNINDLTWMSLDQLNNYCMHFNPPPLVPVPWALWQKVVVGNSAPSAEFKDDGTICIQLINNDVWIDSGGN